MRMLFSSSDPFLVEEAQAALARMNISSEVRVPPVAEAGVWLGQYPELWIRREEDFEPAVRLSVSRRLLLRKE